MALDGEGIFQTSKDGTCLQFASMYREAPLPIPWTNKISWRMDLNREGIWTGKHGSCLQFSSMKLEAPFPFLWTENIIVSRSGSGLGRDHLDWLAWKLSPVLKFLCYVLESLWNCTSNLEQLHLCLVTVGTVTWTDTPLGEITRGQWAVQRTDVNWKPADWRPYPFTRSQSTDRSDVAS
ncbi:hypothetical protein GE061_004261 [Apolygus lucorum]|uniref:Uncharacterized protein n=1 Tax=Apolygus lucorum TaxID=248454 RepID=A0A8S9X2P0_APOLU|nr:hypothetical protein GE061_004261 [Apolygus lucorum]